MGAEVELVSDGDGLAVIGDPTSVERFLADEGLVSSVPVTLPGGARAMATGAAVLDAGATIAENAGRWVKLTAESAEKVKKYGLTPTKTPGVSHAMAGARGDIKGWLQIANGPKTLASNPAVLTGGAGLMAQLAMQQTMGEVTAYLARIDKKVDAVLKAQKDAVVAGMVGVGLQIDEAMTVRAHVGRVNEVTWSKVQGSSGVVAETQAYALKQLEGLAEDLETQSRVGGLKESTTEVAGEVREWLAVLARCFQLQDALAVLELDRVAHTTPDDLDSHRLGLRAARLQRRDAIAGTTGRLLERLVTAAETANDKVLLHPAASPKVVRAVEQGGESIGAFHDLLQIDAAPLAVAARPWRTAAGEVRDRAVAGGVEGLGVAQRVGVKTGSKAKSTAGKVTREVRQRLPRRSDEG